MDNRIDETPLSGRYRSDKPTPPAPAMPDELTTLRQRLADAEAATLNIRDAMTAENLRVAAAAARWEGAARIMAKEIKVHRWSVDPGHHEETDEAIRTTDQNLTASALVREGGGGA